MIRVTETMWVGNAADGAASKVRGVLNVAHDLTPERWHLDRVEYAQVGLVDGPGNPLCAYVAAVLALHVLLKRRERVLVCGHDHGRPLAVALMYLEATGGAYLGWEGRLQQLCERLDWDVPEPHAAHREAFDAMPWGKLDGLLS